MATTDYEITVDDAYVVPEGPLTKAQYVEFVMNKAAESYMVQYGTDSYDNGIQAACDAYNEGLPVQAE